MYNTLTEHRSIICRRLISEKSLTPITSRISNIPWTFARYSHTRKIIIHGHTPCMHAQVKLFHLSTLSRFQFVMLFKALKPTPLPPTPTHPHPPQCSSLNKCNKNHKMSTLRTLLQTCQFFVSHSQPYVLIWPLCVCMCVCMHACVCENHLIYKQQVKPRAGTCKKIQIPQAIWLNRTKRKTNAFTMSMFSVIHINIETDITAHTKKHKKIAKILYTFQQLLCLVYQ